MDSLMCGEVSIPLELEFSGCGSSLNVLKLNGFKHKSSEKKNFQ